LPDFGVMSMTAPLRDVAVRRPPKALAEADPEAWNYKSTVDLAAARAEHDIFVSLLEDFGTNVHYMSDREEDCPDSMFTYDPSLLTTAGAIIGRSGKDARLEEARIHEAFYHRLSVPILGRIEPPGRLDFGDAFWLAEDLMMVGRGYRTNDDAIDQLKAILAAIGVTVMAVDLPSYNGSKACMHLMSLVSLLGPDLALVNVRFAPVRLLEALGRHGIDIVPAPEDDYESSNTISANILALSDRQVVMVEGMDSTKAVLVEAGCNVRTFPGEELCLKTEGGPTCLTRPLKRG